MKTYSINPTSMSFVSSQISYFLSSLSIIKTSQSIWASTTKKITIWWVSDTIDKASVILSYNNKLEFDDKT